LKLQNGNVKEAIELYLETLTDEERKEALKQEVVGIQKAKVPWNHENI